MLTTHKSLDTVNSASTDGAPNMTGVDNGALRLLEAKLERPITWIVCISHGVELCLRKIFEAIGNSFLHTSYKNEYKCCMYVRRCRL